MFEQFSFGSAFLEAAEQQMEEKLGWEKQKQLQNHIWLQSSRWTGKEANVASNFNF